MFNNQTQQNDFMKQRKTLIINTLKSYAEERFGEHFMIIFGSYAYDLAKSNSDVDTICFCKSFYSVELNEFKMYFYKMCTGLGASLKAQIPHERSLMISYKDLRKAVIGCGFIKQKPRTIIVPDRVETREFYLSDQMRLRFAFNAITTKNIFVSGNFETYLGFKRIALQNLIGFIYLINNTDSLSLDELVERSIVDRVTGRSQGAFLGFKNLQQVRVYLSNIYSTQLHDLIMNGTLFYSGGKYVIKNESWLYELMVECK